MMAIGWMLRRLLCIWIWDCLNSLFFEKNCSLNLLFWGGDVWNVVRKTICTGATSEDGWGNRGSWWTATSSSDDTTLWTGKTGERSRLVYHKCFDGDYQFSRALWETGCKQCRPTLGLHIRLTRWNEITLW